MSILKKLLGAVVAVATVVAVGVGTVGIVAVVGVIALVWRMLKGNAEQDGWIAEQEKKIAENKRRINTPCRFSQDLTQADFVALVERSARNIKRLDVFVDGHMVHGSVRSHSGLSTWKFELDFNDYGNITGNYWCQSSNFDSVIPKHLGECIKNDLIAHGCS